MLAMKTTNLKKMIACWQIGEKNAYFPLKDILIPTQFQMMMYTI